MDSRAIDEEQVLKALHSLDFDLWPQVVRYIQSLQNQSVARDSHVALTIPADVLAVSDVVGIWQERTDIQDSTDFARQLRTDVEQQRMKRDAIS